MQVSNTVERDFECRKSCEVQCRKEALVGGAAVWVTSTLGVCGGDVKEADLCLHFNYVDQVRGSLIYLVTLLSGYDFRRN